MNWIDVSSDIKPREGQCVLLRVVFIDEPVYYIGYYYAPKFHPNEKINAAVTHWCEIIDL